MHRKSAYILFLAVLGMLVIGIVMLFSTSAFARDSHGDVYFFIRRQAIWLGVGLAVCTVAALIDYHFWQRTWFGLVSHSLRWRFASFRISECALTVRAGGLASVSSVFNPLRLRRSLRCFFSPLGFRVMKRQPVVCSAALFFRSRSSLCCSRLFSPRWTSERPSCSARPHLS
ncbi:MAG: hypothetical protein DMF17_01380 [Verrucomicrobia bacterium]|nr:MAG: hypothetical protein DMF17_01380 [Verrucomicrobiota bacterium]